MTHYSYVTDPLSLKLYHIQSTTAKRILKRYILQLQQNGGFKWYHYNGFECNADKQVHQKFVLNIKSILPTNNVPPVTHLENLADMWRLQATGANNVRISNKHRILSTLPHDHDVDRNTFGVKVVTQSRHHEDTEKESLSVYAVLVRSPVKIVQNRKGGPLSALNSAISNEIQTTMINKMVQSIQRLVGPSVQLMDRNPVLHVGFFYYAFCVSNKKFVTFEQTMSTHCVDCATLLKDLRSSVDMTAFSTPHIHKHHSAQSLGQENDYVCFKNDIDVLHSTRRIVRCFYALCKCTKKIETNPYKDEYQTLTYSVYTTPLTNDNSILSQINLHLATNTRTKNFKNWQWGLELNWKQQSEGFQINILLHSQGKRVILSTQGNLFNPSSPSSQKKQYFNFATGKLTQSPSSCLVKVYHNKILKLLLCQSSNCEGIRELVYNGNVRTFVHDFHYYPGKVYKNLLDRVQHNFIEKVQMPLRESHALIKVKDVQFQVDFSVVCILCNNDDVDELRVYDSVSFDLLHSSIFTQRCESIQYIIDNMIPVLGTKSLLLFEGKLAITEQSDAQENLTKSEPTRLHGKQNTKRVILSKMFEEKPADVSEDIEEFNGKALLHPSLPMLLYTPTNLEDESQFKFDITPKRVNVYLNGLTINVVSDDSSVVETYTFSLASTTPIGPLIMTIMRKMFSHIHLLNRSVILYKIKAHILRRCLRKNSANSRCGEVSVSSLKSPKSKKKWVYCPLTNIDCFALKNYCKRETNLTAYMLRILGSSVVHSSASSNSNITVQIKQLEIDKLTGFFREDKKYFQVVKHPDDTNKTPRIVMALGPSASGKTHMVKKILNMFQYTIKDFPAYFLTIDGGIFREMSQVYSTILDVINTFCDDVVGFSNLSTVNVIKKLIHGSIFNSSRAKKQFLQWLKITARDAVSLYVPLTLSTYKGAKSVMKQYLSITNDQNWIACSIWQHMYPSGVHKGKVGSYYKSCNKTEEHSCLGTVPVGKERATKEGKRYSKFAWLSSMQNSKKMLKKAPGIQLEIHNSGKEERKAMVTVHKWSESALEEIQSNEEVAKLGFAFVE